LAVGSTKRGRPLMPFLDELARRGTYFSTTIDNTASGRTTDAEFLVLTSAVPRTRPPIFVSESLARIPSLPRELHRAGYRAVSIHGFRGSFWHRAAAHRDLGYDEDIFEDKLAGAERIGWGVSDEAVLAAAAREIKASTQPLFLHVILLTNHHPFTYYGQSIHQPLKTIEESFVQSVGYVDRCIAGFYAELERQGVAGNCVVAVFSDHDSGITDKLGLFLDSAPPRRYADTVPLIVTGLRGAPQTVTAVTGLQDLPVLVLEELGLPVPVTFTGNGLASLGSTVGPIHGALRTNAAGAIESYTPPVAVDELTTLSLYHPEKLADR
jgi:lipoteichoic acid synthase